jgi:16S rRNA (guanine966-N2)-methyltransferase
MGIRVIGGDLKGRKLFTSRGLHVRPTADRVKESVFNILSHQVRQAIVLDLFAGTGALGIEALSRGAEFTVFIDNQKRACEGIERNIRTCKLENRSELISWNAVKNLCCIRSRRPPFNLVFIDPPYDKQLIEPVLQNLVESDALKPDAVIVAEHAVSERFEKKFNDLALADQRTYGKTLVSFFHYMI